MPLDGTMAQSPPTSHASPSSLGTPRHPKLDRFVASDDSPGGHSNTSRSTRASSSENDRVALDELIEARFARRKEDGHTKDERKINGIQALVQFLDGEDEQDSNEISHGSFKTGGQEKAVSGGSQRDANDNVLHYTYANDKQADVVQTTGLGLDTNALDQPKRTVQIEADDSDSPRTPVQARQARRSPLPRQNSPPDPTHYNFNQKGRADSPASTPRSKYIQEGQLQNSVDRQQALSDANFQLNSLKREVSQIQHMVDALKSSLDNVQAYSDAQHSAQNTSGSPSYPRSNPRRGIEQAVSGSLGDELVSPEEVLDFVRKIDSLVWMKRESRGDSRRDEILFKKKNMQYLLRRLTVWEEVVRRKEEL